MENGFLTVKEVAQYLKVTELTVRRYLESGVLKGYKIGNRWRVKKSDLEEYLKGLKNQ